MSKVKITGNASGTGTLTISAPNTDTDRSLTLPDGAGEILTDASNITVQATENVPIFRAYPSSSKTFSSYTWTKAQLDTTGFDSNSYFATSNYRYTPQVEGYYQFYGQIKYSTGSWDTTHLGIKKNTTFVAVNFQWWNSTYVDDKTVTVSDIIYLNGSTDFVELWVYGNSDNTETYGGSSSEPYESFFEGHLIKSGA